MVVRMWVSTARSAPHLNQAEHPHEQQGLLEIAKIPLLALAKKKLQLRGSKSSSRTTRTATHQQVRGRVLEEGGSGALAKGYVASSQSRSGLAWLCNLVTISQAQAHHLEHLGQPGCRLHQACHWPLPQQAEERAGETLFLPSLDLNHHCVCI